MYDLIRTHGAHYYLVKHGRPYQGTLVMTLERADWVAMGWAA